MGKKGKNKATDLMTHPEKLGATNILKWNVNSRGTGDVHYKSNKFKYEYLGKVDRGLPIEGKFIHRNGHIPVQYEGKLQTILPKSKKLGLVKPAFIMTDNSATTTTWEKNGIIRQTIGKFVNSYPTGPIKIKTFTKSVINSKVPRSKVIMTQHAKNSQTIFGNDGVGRTLLMPGRGRTTLELHSANGKKIVIYNAVGTFDSFTKFRGNGVLNVSHIILNNNVKKNDVPLNYRFIGKFKGANGGIMVSNGDGLKEFDNGRVEIIKNGKTDMIFSSRTEMKKHFNQLKDISEKISATKLQSAARSMASRKKTQTLRNKINANRKSFVLNAIIDTVNQNNLNSQKVLRSLTKHSLQTVDKTKKQPYLNALQNNECSICLENFSKGQFITQTACKHKYHKNCLKQFYEKKDNKLLKVCPQCRKPINHQRKSNTHSSHIMLGTFNLKNQKK